MKKLIAILILLAAVPAFAAKPVLAAQATVGGTVTLTGGTNYSVDLTWTDSGCTSTNPCTFTIYRIDGSCPGTLVGSSGWTVVTTTASQVFSASDTTGVDGNTYSYVGKANIGSASSNPSNCATFTLPAAVPAPAGVTATAQ
jgi:hypothetical protein